VVVIPTPKDVSGFGDLPSDVIPHGIGDNNRDRSFMCPYMLPGNLSGPEIDLMR
jgi:hypothetical protein